MHRSIGSWGSRNKIDNSPFWVYGGGNYCAYIYRNHLHLVKLVAMSVYYDFPKAIDKRLSIGDACPPTGNCKGHPGSSHGTLCSLDTNYYTLLESNTTQYRPGRTGIDPISNLIKMWKPGKAGEELIEDVFDWERNFIFFYRLRQIFPRCVISINNVLRDVIMENLKRKHDYSFQMRKDLYKFIQVNVGTTYRHHTHAHIALGKNINWEFDVKNFLHLIV